MLLSGVFATSCSDDEEILEPSVGVVDNLFAVPDDATGPEAELRRNFFKETGTYLMFNDLLSHTVIGQDAYGNDVYKDEYIDFTYNLTSSGGYAPIFEYITDDNAKEAAADLFLKHMYPHVEGSSLLPFSVLLVDNLQTAGYSGEYKDASTASCWRCLAVSMGKLLEATDEEAATLAKAVLKDLVSTHVGVYNDEFEEFLDLSYEYAGEYITDYIDDWDRSDMTLIYEMGYLSYMESWRGPQSDYFPYENVDFNNFFNAVMDRDEADFMAEFGEYPLIVTKYNIIKNVIISLGYKF
ncbi:MAG: hypothetical protein HFJ92_03020 [Muribaculaceae bacterium]|nr:hypothetical protein [Muribaculaceae bacterium]